MVNEERDDLLDKAEIKLLEAFNTLSSWPAPSRNLEKNISNSICSNIQNICSDFSTLKKVYILSISQHNSFINFTFFYTCLTNCLQVLRAKEEISKVNLPRGLSKTNTPLSAIIEDIVINNEELENLSAKSENIFD